MEDISRELEREIALSKPKPYKQDRRSRIIVVDDFGLMKSGEFLKTLLWVLFIVSVVFFVAAVVFYFLYSGLSKDTKIIKNRLVVAEKKVGALTRDKEVLMARLVISGKEPGLAKIQADLQGKPIVSKIEEKKPVVSKNQEIKPIPPEPEDVEKSEKVLLSEQSQNTIKPQLPSLEVPPVEPMQTTPLKNVKKTVSIEKFTVKKDGSNGDLLVRFDIRNISKTPGDVSGRIFTVLKTDNNLENQWLVVPAASLKNGVPNEYKKGQYFSISHFKPVKFRIKNQASPDFFKRASIFIFNEQADLIFEKLIDITEAE
ncbi:MAG: hypothetical protein GY699_08520 [Desulfobacteraceae bacterium]|nr:hypothetical protein [Desulfobacteraceae bacterium]